ncbi:MAG TPA: biopolymer transporter ExbD [Isosphaeraceae bacterium]|jgi:biopolymer transport protein ExbD|nr:biopolymer transporter ExbD [Isosphaeraceae bacterium]
MSLQFHRGLRYPLATILTIVALTIQLVVAAAAWAQFRIDGKASRPANGPRVAGETAPSLTIDVARDGKLTVNGEVVSLSKLEKLVAQENARGEAAGHAAPIAVRADARGRGEAVNRVLGRLKQAGVRKVRILVAAPEPR